MEVKVNKIQIKGIALKDMLDKKFLEILEKEEIKLDFVNLMTFSITQDKDKNVQISPVNFYHQKKNEIEEKILYIEADNEANLNKVKSAIQKLFK